MSNERVKRMVEEKIQKLESQKKGGHALIRKTAKLGQLYWFINLLNKKPWKRSI